MEKIDLNICNCLRPGYGFFFFFFKYFRIEENYGKYYLENVYKESQI